MRGTKGFTLLELLVVVAIIGILVAVAIPLFSDQMTRAKAATDMANVRSAKAVALTDYMLDSPGIDQTYYFDAGSGQATNDKTAASDIKGYGQSAVEVDGASGIPNADGKARIVIVTIEADGTSLAAWGMVGTALDSFLKDAMDIYASTKEQGDALINAMGALPSQATSEIFGDKKLQNDTATLYWRPRVVTIDGTSTVILYANSDSTGHAAWQGFAFYYNGTLYRSTNTGGYQGRIDRNSIDSTSVQNALNAIGNWEKVD